MADEEVVEGGAEEGAPVEGAEFVPEAAGRPRSDVYTVLLLLALLAFIAGCIVAGRELYQDYDVQFWVFTKK